MNKIKIFNDDLLHQLLPILKNKDDNINLASNEYINRIFSCHNTLDRTGSVNLPIQNYLPTLSLNVNEMTGDCNKVFEELCDKRANELLETKTPLRIFWSGGIDSTGMLISFMKADSKWHEKIQIITTRASITKEYPLFYETHLKDKNILVKDICDVYSIFMANTDRYNLLGIHGSPFPRHTSDTWRKRIKIYSMLDDDGTMSFNTIKDKITIDRGEINALSLFFNKDAVIDQLNQYKNKCPVEINNLLDLQWFIWLSRWGKAYNVCVTRGENPNIFDTIKGFYDTEDFINYALTYNGVLKTQEIKGPIKKIIYDYTNDEDYYLNKEPLASTSASGGASNPPQYFRLIDDVGNVFKSSETIPKDTIEKLLK